MSLLSQQREPNFIIAGSGLSGTSWLTACLLHHPEVYLPAEMRPEPHFFYKSQEYEKGYSYYLQRYFDNVPDHAIAIGERSSSYIFGETVPERMAQVLPNIKILVMLRNPIERAYSNWRFTVQSGLETESFERALALEKQRFESERNLFWREVQPFAYRGRSEYGEQIERLMAFYPKEQVLILNSDHVKKDEPGTLNRICQFLGIDPNFDFPKPGTFPTSSVRSKRLQKLLRNVYGRQFDQAIENTRATTPEPSARKWGFDWLLNYNLTDRHPILKDRTRQQLQKQLEESNRRLAPFIDWDPLVWTS